jgi:hypothetical protein
MSNSEEILFNEYIYFNERFTEYKIKKIVKHNTVFKTEPNPINCCCFSKTVNIPNKPVVIKRRLIKKINNKSDEYFKHNKPLFSGEIYTPYKDKTIVTNPFDDDFKQSKPLFTNPFSAV